MNQRESNIYLDYASPIPRTWSGLSLGRVLAVIGLGATLSASSWVVYQVFHLVPAWVHERTARYCGTGRLGIRSDASIMVVGLFIGAAGLVLACRSKWLRVSALVALIAAVVSWVFLEVQIQR